MSEDDIQRHIEDVQHGRVDPPTFEENDDGTAEVALQKVVCKMCGAVNGREPRPLTVPDVKQECPDCGGVTAHEYVVDSETTVVDTTDPESEGGSHV